MTPRADRRCQTGSGDQRWWKAARFPGSSSKGSNPHLGSSAVDWETGLCPRVDATLQVHRLTALRVEILGDPGRSGPYSADANDTISDLVETRDQLVHRNVHRAGDSASPPLVLSAHVHQHPALADLGRSLGGSHDRNIVE